MIGGATGKGIAKNIMDGYCYIVQNYTPGDEIYLFGFSRGACTVRSLWGLINYCGVLKRSDGEASLEFRAQYAHPGRRIRFVDVWDTAIVSGSVVRMGMWTLDIHRTRMGVCFRIFRWRGR